MKQLIWLKEWITFIVALIAISAVFVRGGKLVEVLDQHTKILADHTEKLMALEEKGTQGLRVHTAADDQRVKELKEQICRQQEASIEITKTLGELKRDSGVALAKIDSLHELIRLFVEPKQKGSGQ